MYSDKIKMFISNSIPVISLQKYTTYASSHKTKIPESGNFIPALDNI